MHTPKMTPSELVPASRFVFGRWIFPRHYITPSVISCGDQFGLCLVQAFHYSLVLLMVGLGLLATFDITRVGLTYMSLDLGLGFDSWTVQYQLDLCTFCVIVMKIVVLYFFHNYACGFVMNCARVRLLESYFLCNWLIL